MGTVRIAGTVIACLQLALGLGCASDTDDGGQIPIGGAAGTAGAGGVGAVSGGGAGGAGGVAGMVVSGGTGGAAGTSVVGGAGGAGGAGGMGGAGGVGGAGAAGGMGGTGGGAPGEGSMGCGNASPPADGMQTIDVDGIDREFIVAVPDDYDPDQHYKLVFAWHGLGGMASQIANGFRGGYYGLESQAMGSTIFVAGQGLDTSNQVGSGPGWDNMGGRDVAFTRKMLEWLRTNYCIDNDRIFSVGMSYGGIMSNTVGCALGDDFRAIAPMSGSGPSAFFGGGMCTGQVAAWLSHGNTDDIVQFSSGEGSRDHWVEANHCDATTMAVGSNGCVAYDGCDDGLPVTWCEFDGGHTVPSFASADIWAFFSQF